MLTCLITLFTPSERWSSLQIFGMKPELPKALKDSESVKVWLTLKDGNSLKPFNNKIYILSTVIHHLILCWPGFSCMWQISSTDWLNWHPQRSHKSWIKSVSTFYSKKRWTCPISMAKQNYNEWASNSSAYATTCSRQYM